MTSTAAAQVDIYEVASHLWDTADELRANSHLKAAEYSIPVLGLIFLKFADSRFTEAEADLAGRSSGRRTIGKADYQSRGVLYLPDQARFANLLKLPEGENIGKAINDAMAAIEDENPQLAGVLPAPTRSSRTTRSSGCSAPSTPCSARSRATPSARSTSTSSASSRSPRVRRAASTSRRPRSSASSSRSSSPSTARSSIRPAGRAACSSRARASSTSTATEASGRLSIYGQERVEETLKLCTMNLAVHGLEGQISQSNAYYEDPFHSVGQFDYVMANPPFNVNRIDKAKLEGDRRYPFGLPRADNGNYIWIQIFYSALTDTGRAGFVMANSAADAGGSELEIRRKLIEDRSVDVIVAVGPNFFYTVTLPVTLWFLDKAKRETDRADKVLFIDARKIFRQIDRAHRDWLPEQIEFLANIARLYRGEAVEDREGSADLMAKSFPEGRYVDVPGLCAVATLEQIEKQGWSLNPGRYVGCSGGRGRRRRLPRAA